MWKILYIVTSMWITIQGLEWDTQPGNVSVCEGHKAILNWIYTPSSSTIKSKTWEFCAHSCAGSRVTIARFENGKFVEGDAQFKGRVTEVENAGISISNISISDVGEYNLDLSDTANTVLSGRAKVELKVPPSGTQKLQITLANAGNDCIKLTCGQITSPGSPTVHLLIKRTTPYSVDRNFLLPLKSGQGVIERLCNETQYGKFICMVDGAAAECLTSGSILKKGAVHENFVVPETPEIMKVESSAKGAEIKFVAGFGGGDTVVFTAEFKKMNDLNYTFGDEKKNKVGKGQEGTIRVTGLEPLTNYTLRVVARNSVGKTASAEVTVTTTESDETPLALIIGIACAVGVVLIIAIVVAVCLCRRSRKRREDFTEKSGPASEEMLPK